MVLGKPGSQSDGLFALLDALLQIRGRLGTQVPGFILRRAPSVVLGYVWFKSDQFFADRKADTVELVVREVRLRVLANRKDRSRRVAQTYVAGLQLFSEFGVGCRQTRDELFIRRLEFARFLERGLRAFVLP